MCGNPSTLHGPCISLGANRHTEWENRGGLIYVLRIRKHIFHVLLKCFPDFVCADVACPDVPIFLWFHDIIKVSYQCFSVQCVCLMMTYSRSLWSCSYLQDTIPFFFAILVLPRGYEQVLLQFVFSNLVNPDQTTNWRGMAEWIQLHGIQTKIPTPSMWNMHETSRPHTCPGGAFSCARCSTKALPHTSKTSILRSFSILEDAGRFKRLVCTRRNYGDGWDGSEQILPSETWGHEEQRFWKLHPSKASHQRNHRPWVARYFSDFATRPSQRFQCFHWIDLTLTHCATKTRRKPPRFACQYPKR